MKLVFFSNFLNHHQLPICLEFERQLGKGNFVFVASQPTNTTCLSLGYEDMNSKYDFVLRTYESKSKTKKAVELAKSFDVAIVGGDQILYKELRLERNLVTFCFTERPLKVNTWKILDPRVFAELFLQYTRYSLKKYYVLCASAYAAKDIALAGFPKSHCYKWGYFPEVTIVNVDRLLSKHDIVPGDKVRILWVARFIDWKHPEKPVLLAKSLKEKGYNFELSMLGEGQMEGDVAELIKENGLEDCVKMCGAKPYKEVRTYMENSHIFIFTSDRNEGWGAVLNEAMSSGCAAVADKNIGAAPFLILDGKNGFLYDGTIEDLVSKVELLIKDDIMRKQLATNAYTTMINEWNASNAVSNFLNLIDGMINMRPAVPRKGPASKV